MFFKYAILKNRYFSAHIVLALILFTGLAAWKGYQVAMITTLIIALAWEIVRYYMGEWKKYAPPEEIVKRLNLVVGSALYVFWQKKRYGLDSIGDMIAAWLGIVLAMGVAYVLP